MTLEQCQSKPFLKKKLVLEKLICKSVFSSVTVLNNDICLPVAVHYCSKLENEVIISKKPSLTKFDSFKCVKIASLELRWKYDFDKEQLPGLWELLCDNCFTSDSVGANCSIKGQTKVNPALRAYDYCLKNIFLCIRKVVSVITVDCESGNKHCLTKIQQWKHHKSTFVSTFAFTWRPSWA